MRWLLRLTVAAGLLAAADGPCCDPAKGDRALLQGTWQLLSIEADVSQLSALCPDDLSRARLTIQGDRCTLTFAGTCWRGAYTAAAGDRTKALDLAITAGPDKGKRVRALYALAGDTLRVCYHPRPGAERPAGFTRAPGSDVLVIIWQRRAP
jgi:uncharacterized protein (TIGR03067 family)